MIMFDYVAMPGDALFNKIKQQDATSNSLFRANQKHARRRPFQQMETRRQGGTPPPHVAAW